jgi:hypothetical protein
LQPPARAASGAPHDGSPPDPGSRRQHETRMPRHPDCPSSERPDTLVVKPPITCRNKAGPGLRQKRNPPSCIMECDRLVKPRRSFQAFLQDAEHPVASSTQYMHNQRLAGKLAGTSGRWWRRNRGPSSAMRYSRGPTTWISNGTRRISPEDYPTRGQLQLQESPRVPPR